MTLFLYKNKKLFVFDGRFDVCPPPYIGKQGRILFNLPNNIVIYPSL